MNDPTKMFFVAEPLLVSENRIAYHTCMAVINQLDASTKEFLEVRRSPHFFMFQMVILLVITLAILTFGEWLSGLITDLLGGEKLFGIDFTDLLTFIVLLLAAGMALSAYFQWRYSYYHIYPDKLVAFAGFIRRSQRDLALSQFSALGLRQDAIGRLLDYGTIDFGYKLLSPAQDLSERLYNISQPKIILEQIEQRIRFLEA